MRADGRIGEGMIGSVFPTDEPKNLECMVGMLDSTDAGNLIFWDDVSGKMLKTEKVTISRQEEIEQFRNGKSLENKNADFNNENDEVFEWIKKVTNRLNKVATLLKDS